MRIYIADYACEDLKKYLSSEGHITEHIRTERVYSEISAHPDIYMCHLGSRLFLGNHNFLGYNYPSNIIYNAASTGKFFIHNLKYTDKELMNTAISLSQELIHVRQGYTKCNIAVINENSIITSDCGIKKACDPYMDVLLISPGYILLPGMNYGFIGGTGGKIGDTFVFNGNLEEHPDFFKIKAFIQYRGFKIRYFRNSPLTDIGSIIACDCPICGIYNNGGNQ